MNKKMFKIISLVLSFVLCVMCITVTAVAGTPGVTLFGNEATPAKPGETIKLYARLTGLSEMAGLDISVTGGTGFAFTGVSVDNISLVADKNYTITDNKIHIVDIFNILDRATLNSAYVTVNAKIAENAQAGEYTVTFKGVLAGKDGKTKLSEGDLATAKVVVREAEKTAQAGTLTAENGMFIPYGSVYNAQGIYADKLNDGSFIVSNGDKYTRFRLDSKTLSTFGVSFAEDNTAIQFGTYAAEKKGKTYGTMCLVGDWDSFKEYYRQAKGYSEVELIEMISQRYDTVMKDNPDATHVIMKCNNKQVKIAVYKVAQTKYMWGKEHNSDLQYALRVVDVAQGQQYTAIGYYTQGDNTVFSTEIKSAEGM